MKLTTFLLVVSLFKVQANSYSQNTRISLDFEDVTIEKIFEEIESKTEFKFFYQKGIFDVKKLVSISVQKKKVSTILTKLFNETDINFEVLNKQILLKLQPEKSKNESPSLKINQPEEQQKEISGIVTDKDGQPLPGASVIEKGTSNGTQTDFDGEFSLTLIDQNAILVVSYLGFATQEMATGEQTSFTITLQEDAAGLDEILIVGYGGIKRKNITGSVTNVSIKELPQAGVSSIAHVLSGQAAGLSANLQSAQVGGAVNLQIRGAATGRSPLIVIDGFPVTNFSNATVGNFGSGDTDAVLSSINPNDIKSIDILKDASATSIYGSRAAGGVILITTKRGKEGQVSVDYSYNVGFSEAFRIPETLSAREFMVENNRATKEKYLFDNNAGPYGTVNFNDIASGYTPIYSENDINSFQGNGHNAFDEITRSASQKNHAISIAGGTSTTRYFASFSSFDQKGLVKNNNYNRFTGKINLDQDFGDKIKTGLTLNLSRSKYDNIALQEGYGGATDILRGAMQWNPLIPTRDENGVFTINPIAPQLPNPVSLLDLQSETRTDRLISNAFVSYEILEGLKLKGVVGVDFNQSNAYYYAPTTTNVGVSVGGRADRAVNERTDYQTQLTLTYKKQFSDKHTINALLGTEYMSLNWEGFNAGNQSFLTDQFLWNNLGLGTSERPTVGSYAGKSETQSFIGRVSYDYDNKYFLTANLRADGSSNFAENHQWGYFPGISVGWDMAQEPFMASQKIINYLKLRAGYGQTGNDQIGSAFFNSYSAQGAVLFGNRTVIPVRLSQLGNPDLKWETQTDFNIGLDFALLDHKLSGSLEYFNRVITDILGQKTTTSASEVTSITANLNAEKQTYGVEMSLNSINMESDDFKWTTGATFTYYRDKWKKRDPSFVSDIHQDPNAFFGELWYHPTSGLIQEGENIDWQRNIPGLPKLNDIDGYALDSEGRNIVDANGRPQRTGAPDGKIDNADLVKVGVNQPFTIGLNNTVKYKNFDLSVGIYGKFNHWKYNSLYEVGTDTQLLFQDGANMLTVVKDRWNSDNPSGTTPSSLNRLASASRPDTFLEKASFVRVRNIDLAYTIPLKTNKISNLRVYTSILNPILITSYNGLDPESDNKSVAYPNQRTYTLGLELKF